MVPGESPGRVWILSVPMKQSFSLHFFYSYDFHG